MRPRPPAACLPPPLPRNRPAVLRLDFLHPVFFPDDGTNAGKGVSSRRHGRPFFHRMAFPLGPGRFSTGRRPFGLSGLLVSLLPFIVLGLTWALFGLGFSFIFLRRPLAAFIALPFSGRA